MSEVIASIFKFIITFKLSYKLKVSTNTLFTNCAQKGSITIRNDGKKSIILSDVGFFFKRTLKNKLYIDRDNANLPEVTDALIEIEQKRGSLVMNPGDVINLELYCPFFIKEIGSSNIKKIYVKDTESRIYYSKKLSSYSL